MTTELVNATPQSKSNSPGLDGHGANLQPGEVGSYSLVRGTFSAEEAREVLLSLIEDKITFHRRHLWSRRERFGEVADPSRCERIEQLLSTKRLVTEAVNQAAAAGYCLEIHCDIQLRMRDT